MSDAKVYKLSDEVKKFLLSGHSESDCIKANRIIEEAEKNGINEYEIALTSHTYIIRNGQIAGCSASART